MKTPQRRFVVEFKSGRRQPKAKTNSIWGDTDLKALAREVEDTAPHLFTSNEGPDTADSGETRPADAINAEAANERADAVDVSVAPIPFVNGTEVEISKHHEANHPAEATVQVQESQPASEPRTTSSGTPRKRAHRAPAQTSALNSNVGHDDQEPQTGTVDNPISFDELAALDADNKRLKRLLAERLRAQNLWLKKMLERFDAE
ncbi:hypothetical protein [Sinorhizobium meliloti]|uniref:hypothetical protein n=1 Tax=Rhizobium meliloti TaxID=382 RepID=UPI000FD1AD05|nr:hypothetical protein [Sinorhizobium meliloti]MQV20527.1 hypothetical protein [Sinorhizobium meliloti]MQV32709.1 hypothetical protein [Sinorhizobium meliloti]RVE85647.1 hypothetical protein CN240_01675 [Sinorhizobium meliloti]RVG49020.1 hypothetical protein CN227_03470 [Sinorhizobium meliloti]RVM03836.1 hypothetical protein CN125_29250 [Sinorhizobium meliloti]